METATSTQWRFSGECQNHDPEIWFPFPKDTDAIARAKAICLTCPVRGACLAYATELRIDYGIWGGMTETERDTISARDRMPPKALPRDQVQHGTSSGYMWHRRYDKRPCQDCLIAERERGAIRRRARQRETAS